MALRYETLTPGDLYDGVPMADYLALDALGSSRLEWLGVSPLHYKYMLTAPRVETPATAKGTAVHMATLEPELFAARYALEPDPLVVAPDATSPRATKAYKEAVAALTDAGRIVLKRPDWDEIALMAQAVRGHKAAAAVLARAAAFESTGLWMNGDHVCRGRFDVLGKGMLADLKTTRSLKDFSPWTITKMGYYRQMGFYVDGLNRLGFPIEHVFLIAVESSAPYDVGVFCLDGPTLQIGMDECKRLMDVLSECERKDEWPGRFPTIQQAMLSDAVALQLPELGEEE